LNKGCVGLQPRREQKIVFCQSRGGGIVEQLLCMYSAAGTTRVNPQVNRLRQNLIAAGVQDSLDDDEMREYDPREHLETLGAGIPQHLGELVRATPQDCMTLCRRRGQCSATH
jgi:hypothetical protein